MGIYDNYDYTPVIKQGNGKWTIEISDVPNKTSIQKGDFPASHVRLSEGSLDDPSLAAQK